MRMFSIDRIDDLTNSAESVYNINSEYRNNNSGRYYTYDTLDRVVDVDYHDDSEESFTYDKLGNRIEAQHRNKQGTLTYARNAVTNRYDATGDYDIEGVYDAAGNFEYMSRWVDG